MSEHIGKMRAWLDSFPADIAAVQAVVEEAKLPRDVRLLSAAALSYLITRLDLIPDWEETAGLIDDAMVLRVAMAVASEQDLDALEDDAQRVVHRLANEADVVREFLGADLYAKLRHHVLELVNAKVRGRLPSTILDDEKQRRLFFGEVKDEVKRPPAGPVKDPAGIARMVKNYLSTKLK